MYMAFSLDLNINLIFLLFIQILFFSFFIANIWYHLIILLIILEMFILLIFFSLNIFLILNKFSIFFIFIFITLRVAEARIGLALLTILVRTHGNDYININIF